MVETQGTLWSRYGFVGGALCLDFVNTVASRPSADRDDLRTYEDLLRWGVAAGSLSPTEAEGLRRRATEHPEAARTAAAHARSVRAAMFEALAARIDKTPLPAKPMAEINAALGAAMAHLRLADGTGAGEIGWAWDTPEETLDRPLWPVLRSLADVMTEAPADRLRLCAGDSCDWMFLDTSKNGKRCWCDMSVCGNRAKATRHYSRRKEG
ncbi:ABATE domain-containing protein [Inquilinus sp. CAU 1745]|uniref:CGNR zinc finger domain-containing protein n=1 Tax=Inquilinus sp. CAU 1745 TaxID=3140369 RepID=UPI00325B993A